MLPTYSTSTDSGSPSVSAEKGDVIPPTREDPPVNQTADMEILRGQFRGLYIKLANHMQDIAPGTSWACVKWLEQALTEIHDQQRKETAEYLKGLSDSVKEDADLEELSANQKEHLFFAQRAVTELASYADSEEDDASSVEGEERPPLTLLDIFLQDDAYPSEEEEGQDFKTLFEAIRAERFSKGGQRFDYAPQWIEKWSSAFRGRSFPLDSGDSKPRYLHSSQEDFAAYLIEAIKQRSATTEDMAHFIFLTEVSNFLKQTDNNLIPRVCSALRAELAETKKELTQWADSAAVIPTNASSSDGDLVQQKIFKMRKLLIQYRYLLPLYSVFQGLFDQTRQCFSTNPELSKNLTQQFHDFQDLLKLPTFYLEEDQAKIEEEESGSQSEDPIDLPQDPPIDHYIAKPLVEHILQMLQEISNHYVSQAPGTSDLSLLKTKDTQRLSIENIAVTQKAVEQLLIQIKDLMQAIYHVDLPHASSTADDDISDADDDISDADDDISDADDDISDPDDDISDADADISAAEAYRQIVATRLFGEGSIFALAEGYSRQLKSLLPEPKDAEFSLSEQRHKMARFQQFCAQASLTTNPARCLGEFEGLEDISPKGETIPHQEEELSVQGVIYDALKRLCAESVFAQAAGDAERAAFAQNLPNWCVFLSDSVQKHSHILSRYKLLQKLKQAIHDPKSNLSLAVTKQRFDATIATLGFGVDLDEEMTILQALQFYFHQQECIAREKWRPLTANEDSILENLNKFQKQRHLKKIAKIRAVLEEFHEEAPDAKQLLENLQELQITLEQKAYDGESFIRGLDKIESEALEFSRTQLAPLEQELQDSLCQIEASYQVALSWPDQFLNPIRDSSATISRAKWDTIQSTDKKILILAKTLARKEVANRYKCPVEFYNQMFSSRAPQEILTWLSEGDRLLPWGDASSEQELTALFHGRLQEQALFKKYFEAYLKEARQPKPASFDPIALKMLDDKIHLFLDRAQNFSWRFEGILDAEEEGQKWRMQYQDLLKKRADLLVMSSILYADQPPLSQKYRLFSTGLYSIEKGASPREIAVQPSRSSVLSLSSWRKGADRLGATLSRIYEILKTTLLRVKRWAMKSPSVEKVLTVGEKVHAHKATFISFRKQHAQPGKQVGETPEQKLPGGDWSP